MRGEEMLERMELIDCAYIEAADKKYRSFALTGIRIAGLAACLLLITAGVLIGARLIGANGREPGYPPMMIVPYVQSDEPSESDRIIVNDAESVIEGSRAYIPGYFTEELNEQTSSALLPDAQTTLDISGYIGYDGSGKALEVILDVTAPDCPESVNAHISQFDYSRYYDLEAGPEVSVVNGKVFTVYRCTITDGKIWLDARAEVNENNLSLHMETSSDAIAEAQRLFAASIEYFSHYEDGHPDITAVTPQSIPEFFDITLSVNDAGKDADFGRYMLTDVPGGFTEESVRRYKDQRSDYLSGMWTRGYDELSWKVTRYTDEHAGRITGVGERENYDLSLYPIPRADSVPDELREIVDDPIFLAEELTLEAVYTRAYKAGEAGDSEGWRMNFSVKLGDILVTVRAKGVEPEWLYEQIRSMI